MSAIEDCKREVQSIVDTMSSEIQFTLEHGFEKMQNNSNFKKWILDLEERIKQDTPSQLVASQKSWTLSIILRTLWHFHMAWQKHFLSML